MIFYLKSYIFIIIFAFVSSPEIKAEDFNIGFNQAWINNSYDGQWSDAGYDINEVRRVLDLTKEAGAKTVRMWLFQGTSNPSLIWTNGKVSSLNPEFLKNFEEFLKEAKIRDLKVYITLFDFAILRHSKDQVKKDRWWNLMNNEFGALDAFQNNALIPLLKLINQNEYRATIFGIDLANEIDSSIIFNQFKDEWNGLNNFVCKLTHFIHVTAAKDNIKIKVTASVGWPYIPLYSKGAENIILEASKYLSCVDFYDLHLYNNNGNIDKCEQIKALTKKNKKQIYLGEFGQFSKEHNDVVQEKNTKNFIKNAKACGFTGALAWRLVDGFDDSSYLSFEKTSKGNMRKAYYIIKAKNEEAHLQTSIKDRLVKRNIATVAKKKFKKKLNKN